MKGKGERENVQKVSGVKLLEQETEKSVPSTRKIFIRYNFDSLPFHFLSLFLFLSHSTPDRGEEEKSERTFLVTVLGASLSFLF